MRPPNSSPRGSDLAPHRPDPKLLAALMRQHRRRFAPGHGITALLPSCGKDRCTRTGSRPRLGHRRLRVPPCRNLLPSLHPLYWASVGVGGSTASLPRAPGRRPLTRECIPPDSAFPPRLRPAGLARGTAYSRPRLPPQPGRQTCSAGTRAPVRQQVRRQRTGKPALPVRGSLSLVQHPPDWSPVHEGTVLQPVRSEQRHARRPAARAPSRAGRPRAPAPGEAASRREAGTRARGQPRRSSLPARRRRADR